MKHSFGAEPRTIVVKTRLSSAEKEELDKIIERTDLSISEYLRCAIFGTPIQESSQIPEANIKNFEHLIAEYGRIGNNMNQIARFLNSGGDLSSALAKELKRSIWELTDLKYKTLDALEGYALMF